MTTHTAQIDQNDVKTWLLYNETTGLIENAVVDPITGALLIYGVVSDLNTPTAINHALIDQNDVKTKLLYNETTGLVESARCGSGGELLVLEVS